MMEDMKIEDEAPLQRKKTITSNQGTAEAAEQPCRDPTKLIQQKAPNLVFLMETRKKADEIKRLRHKGGLQNVIGVDCNGEGRQRGGGLAILLKSSIEVKLLSMSTNHIDMEVKKEGETNCWRATDFYSWLEIQNKKLSWDLLDDLGQNSNTPWVVFDGAMENLGWKEKFPKTIVQHLPRYKSDHSPILIDLNGEV
ncbi:hypothetical protein Ahy_B04g071317 [Arachis hypogaea]|uniref:Endonuclease/exonuclease/phosphatase domain-containing protein n=1 Tax=Arachis hypogaea TaxID=3818 RepID=A0A444ZKF4_ARAHY|nr:hypothetical protein Ahy_B04g071317 [Arachis hypogaea]